MSNESPGALTPELIDELCSADIDGELDAACADLGIPVDDARAAIATNATRRGALARASSAVGAPLDGDSLDELERRRIARLASGRAFRSKVQDRRRLVFLGAAAVVAAIAIVAVIATRNNGGDKHVAVRGGAGPSTQTTLDIGIVKTGHEIESKLTAPTSDAALGGPGNPTSESSATAPHTGKSVSTGATSTPAPGATASRSATRCLASLPGAADASGLQVVATAQLRNRSVVVARGTLRGKHAIWAFVPAKCTPVLFYDGP